MALHTHKIFPSCTLAKPSTADWFWIMGYMVKTMNSMIVSPISHLCNKSSPLVWGLVYGLWYWWLRHSGSPQILCVWMAEALRAEKENPDSDYVSVWRMMNVCLFKAEGQSYLWPTLRWLICHWANIRGLGMMVCCQQGGRSAVSAARAILVKGDPYWAQNNLHPCHHGHSVHGPVTLKWSLRKPDWHP